MKSVAISLLVFIALILAWEISFMVVDTARIDRGQTSLQVFVASPSTIAETFLIKGDVIVEQLLVTLARAGVGLLLGTCIAWLFALGFLLFSSLRSAVLPLNMAINSFPIVGFAPAIVLLFGQGSWFGIVFIAALVSYFPILVMLDQAVAKTPREYVDVFKVFNASKAQIVRLLYIPMLMPALTSSLRLAIPASIIGATIGEWFGTRSGIGHLVTVSLYQLDPGTLYAALIALTATSLVLVGVLKLAERFLFPWREAMN